MAIKKLMVSRDENVYEAWPDVVLTDGGKLIAVFTECEHHLNRAKSRIVIKESVDRGETWSEKKYFTELGTKESYFNCARIGKFKDGSLYILCDKIYGNENNRAEIYIWYGDKEGTHWQEPVLCPLQGIVPDKITETPTGRRIVSAHFRNHDLGRVEQYLVYTDDKGKTWSDKIVVASHPDMFLCEGSLLVYDKAIVAFLRENSVAGYDILKTVSYNNGETWSEIYPTSIDCGHRPVSGFLQDGRAMITYRYIPCGTQNVFVAFMPKESLLETSRRKQKVRIMPLDYDRNPSPDLGYTGWVQFEDGEIFVINYIKDDADKAFIRGYRFYPSDVELPVTEKTTANVFN